jgi:peptidyl-prolyl cis-trans isomerase D
MVTLAAGVDAAGTVTAGLEPPNVLIDALSRYQTEQRTVEYVKLDAAQAGTIDPPSPETLAAYFDDHKTQFRAPEYRKISFVAVTPEEIGSGPRFPTRTPEGLRAAPRQARHAGTASGVADRVPNAEEAAAARGRIAGGMSFEDLAKERGSTCPTSTSAPSRNPPSSIPRSRTRRFRCRPVS